MPDIYDTLIPSPDEPEKRPAKVAEAPVADQIAQPASNSWIATDSLSAAAPAAAPSPPEPSVPEMPPMYAARRNVMQEGLPGRAPPPPDMRDDSWTNPWRHVWRVLSARARAWSDHAGRSMVQRTLKIGISARIFHPEPGAKGLRGRTLQYLEESIAQWVMSRDVMVFMIPTVNTNGLVHPSSIRLRDYAKHLDGLVLQGGADVSPQSYAQQATRPEWSGDPVRDMYELELLYEFNEARKPILGICRGCQLINVAFGGTLYQDIASDLPDSSSHVNDQYDKLHHDLRFPDDSTLGPLFAGQKDFLVNSIHHQAVRDLGRDLSVEAFSGADNVIEAIRYRKAPFVVGLQWHPEFHRAGGGKLLDCTPILDGFLRAARETRL